MPFQPTGFQPFALAQWLEGLRGEILARVPGAQVADQRYILARVLLVFAEELARADGGFALALAMTDPAQAEAYWLRLIGLRINVPAIPASRSLGLGEVTATPGTVFTGAEEAEDQTTGQRWTVGPGTVGITGVSIMPVSALVDGPVTGSAVAAEWKLKTDVAGWTAFRVLELTELGRLAETDTAHRVRIFAALGEQCATEYGDLTRFQRLAVEAGQNALLGYKTNREDVADENGIPPHHFEVVFAQGLPPEQIANAIRETASSTAGTWGNREVTIAGPYRPLTYKYSEGVDARVYARVTANTVGAKGTVPTDLAAQLAAGLAAWSLTLGSGVQPTATDAEKYLTNLLSQPLPVVDLEVTFSLDAVTYASFVPVTIRQQPRINNAPTPAELIGNVPGPYVIGAFDVIDMLMTPGSGGLVTFSGSETTVPEVAATFMAAGLDGLIAEATTDNPLTATIRLASVAVGADAWMEVISFTPALMTTLGLGGGATVHTGRDSDVEVTILT